MNKLFIEDIIFNIARTAKAKASPYRNIELACVFRDPGMLEYGVMWWDMGNDSLEPCRQVDPLVKQLPTLEFIELMMLYIARRFAEGIRD